jgi:hypothetical protein
VSLKTKICFSQNLGHNSSNVLNGQFLLQTEMLVSNMMCYQHNHNQEILKMQISSKMKSFVGMAMILIAFVDAQCIGVYNTTQLRDAITTANDYSATSPTIITLCSDFTLGSESVTPVGETNNTIFDLSNRNIRLNCEKATSDTAFPNGQPRCVFDAQFSNKTIFAGVRTKIFVFGANFINAGYLLPYNTRYGANGAWAFQNATVIIQECSFLNNIGANGGAINLIGIKSVLRLRSGACACISDDFFQQ